MILTKEQTQYIKGLAILLILICHVSFSYIGGGIGVGLFLIVSGYGLQYSYEQKKLKGFWKNKLFKVYIPYWIFTILWVTIDYFLGIKHGIRNVGFSLLAYQNSIDTTMWYMGILTFWYLTFYISHLFNNKTVHNVLLLIATIGCYALATNGFFGSMGGSEYYFLMFPVGVLLSKYKNSNFLSSNLKNIIIASIVLVAIDVYKFSFYSIKII